MYPQSRVVLAHAILQEDIVGLLETDAVAVVVPHHAILDDRAEAAIKKDAATTTAVQINIPVFGPLNDQVFDARGFGVAAGHDRKHGCSLSLVSDHAIGVQRHIDGEGVADASRNAAHRGWESAR